MSVRHGRLVCQASVKPDTFARQLSRNAVLKDATRLASLASSFTYQKTCAATHTGELRNGRDCGTSPLVCRRCVLRVRASVGHVVSQSALLDAPGRVLDDRSQARCQSRLLAAHAEACPCSGELDQTFTCVRLSAASGDSFGSILSWGTDQWSAQLDKLMREVDLQYGTVEGQAAAGGFVMQFPVDLRESTDAYQCAMDVSGMAKADIKVCF